MLKLRNYQTDIVEDVRNLMKQGYKGILIQSPTGSGKTALTTHMIGTAAEKGMRSLFMVHRRELVKQSAHSFLKGEVPHGIIAAGFTPNPKRLVQICSVGTLARRLDRIETPQLIVWDECHHISAGTWDKIYKHFPKAFHVGLTATPQRLDGKGLDKHFQKMVNGPTVSWLIENKFLTPYKLYAPSSINLNGVRKSGHDYRRSDSEEVVDKPTITGSAIREYRKVCDGKRAVVFCVSVNHSKNVVHDFNRAGIPAIHVDGESSIYERDRALQLFNEGKIKILSNVDLFGEGFDLPALEAVILLRPTQSLGLYLQQCGRVLRTAPGKDVAYILDHVGNVLRHGLPDQEHEWDLRGRKFMPKGDEDDGPKIKSCPNCFAVVPPGPKCPYCHTPFEVKERELIEVEGDLEEVDPKVLRKKRRSEQMQAETLEDLEALAKQRGYSKGWAKHIMRAREAKKLKGRR